MWFMIVLLAVILIVSADAKGVENCPKYLPRDSYLQVHGDRCYYFYLNELKTYGQAEDTCYENGGILAMVKSKKINTFLHHELEYTYTDAKTRRHAWIGLNDLQKEGQFHWLDGSKMEYDNFAAFQGTKNQNLHVTQYTEDCVAMDFKTGMWYDYPCDSVLLIDDEKRPFICEYLQEDPNAPKTTPPVLPDDSIDIEDCPKQLERDNNLYVHGDMCYYFHIDQRKEYGPAADVCVENGGTLALVKSENINRFLHRTLEEMDNSDGYRAWIGLNDLQQENQFRWLDGSKMDYENFATFKGTKGIFSHPNKDCVAIDFASGLWYDYSCTSVYLISDNAKPFICQYQATKPTVKPTSQISTQIILQTTTVEQHDNSTTSTQASVQTTMRPTSENSTQAIYQTTVEPNSNSSKQATVLVTSVPMLKTTNESVSLNSTHKFKTTTAQN